MFQPSLTSATDLTLVIHRGLDVELPWKPSWVSKPTLWSVRIMAPIQTPPPTKKLSLKKSWLYLLWLLLSRLFLLWPYSPWLYSFWSFPQLVSLLPFIILGAAFVCGGWRPGNRGCGSESTYCSPFARTIFFLINFCFNGRKINWTCFSMSFAI